MYLQIIQRQVANYNSYMQDFTHCSFVSAVDFTFYGVVLTDCETLLWVHGVYSRWSSVHSRHVY